MIRIGIVGVGFMGMIQNRHQPMSARFRRESTLLCGGQERAGNRVGTMDSLASGV